MFSCSDEVFYLFQNYFLHEIIFQKNVDIFFRIERNNMEWDGIFIVFFIATGEYSVEWKEIKYSESFYSKKYITVAPYVKWMWGLKTYLFLSVKLSKFDSIMVEEIIYSTLSSVVLVLGFRYL